MNSLLTTGILWRECPKN